MLLTGSGVCSRGGAAYSRARARIVAGSPSFTLRSFIGAGLLATLTGAAMPSLAQYPTVAEGQSVVVTVDTGRHLRNELPSTLFGFNTQHYNFENDLWLRSRQTTNPDVVAALRYFPGALYRYPGGLISNRYNWEEAVGPVQRREPQKIVEGAAGRAVGFGVDEYLEFVEAVGGIPFYVLNLVGWDEQEMFRELPGETMAASNARLAAHLKERLEPRGIPRYYQLGNELDRATYQWPHEKYIERSRETMDAILRVDPDARFVAFLRDFDWRYRGDEREGTSSGFNQFIADVLTALPEVNDFSLHFYYDDPGVDNQTKFMPWRLRQFGRAIAAARRVRPDAALNVWITEHARGANVQAGKPMERQAETSNLSATVSTGDFLIALAQMPEVRGASWHALNGGVWQLFDASVQHNDLRPRPVYWGMRVLRSLELPIVFETHTQSPNESGYGGGYDVRAVALGNESNDQLGLWVINRATSAKKIELDVSSWASKSFSKRHFFIQGEAGRSIDDPRVEPVMELSPSSGRGEFSAAGTVILELPPLSVSSFLFTES